MKASLASQIGLSERSPAPPARGRQLLRQYAWRRLPWVMGFALFGLTLPAWVAAVPADWAWARLWGDLDLHWQQWHALGGASAALAMLALARRWPDRAAARRRVRRVGLALAFGAVLLAANLSGFVLPRLPAATAAGEVLRLVSFNVNLGNTDQAPIVEWVRQTDPDVLALLEVTPAMTELLGALGQRYPHAQLRPSDDGFGMAVFSRLPLAGGRWGRDPGGMPTFTAQLCLPDGLAVALYVLHPMPPVNARYLAARDALFRSLPPAEPGALPTAGGLVMGDLNATAWTPALRALGDAGWARATSLRPTWGVGVALPIDHILATQAHWRRVRSGVGPALKSDHLPVWAEVGRTVQGHGGKAVMPPKDAACVAAAVTGSTP